MRARTRACVCSCASVCAHMRVCGKVITQLCLVYAIFQPTYNNVLSFMLLLSVILCDSAYSFRTEQAQDLRNGHEVFFVNLD